MNKKKKRIVDERDEKNLGIASQCALRVVVIYTIIKIIYYLDFSALNTLGFLLWDGLLLVIIGITLFIVTRMRKTYPLPRTHREGKQVAGNHKEARKDRIKKSYLPKALIFSVSWTLASTLRSGFISILVTVILFIIYFLITFGVVFVWGEWNIKSYNQSFEE